MSKATDDLLDSFTRFARTVSKAAAREAPYVRKASGRIFSDDLPALQRSLQQAVDRVLRDLRGRRR